jgi:hypothetical protein
MNRVFFAHPKSWPDEQIDAFVGIVQAALPDAKVVSGRDDFAQNIASEGHIDGWIRSVTRRRDVDTGGRWYRMVVVSEEHVGKATACIAADALDAGMPVVLAQLDEDGTTVARGVPVLAVDVVDPENFNCGWRLVLSDT